MALEAPFWDALEALAAARAVPLARLITEIDAAREMNLAAALRMAVLEAALRGEISKTEPNDPYSEPKPTG